MRVFARAAAAVAVVAALVLAPALPASAVMPAPPPVVPIPDLPSNTLRMTPSGGSWTATDMWKGLLWYAGQGSGTVATVPKPVTPPVPLARKSGVPVVDGLLLGFAIGSAGLQTYTMVTGDNPLSQACGSPYEGVVSFMYPLSAPACQATAVLDTDQAWELIYDGLIVLEHVGTRPSANEGASWGFCYWGASAPPAGTQFVRKNLVTGVWGLSSWPGSPSSACLAMGANREAAANPATYGNPPVMGLKDQATGEITEGATRDPDPIRSINCDILWDDGTYTLGAGPMYRDSEGVPVTAAGLGCKQAWDAKPGAGPNGPLPEKISVDSNDSRGVGEVHEIARGDVPEFDATQKKALDPTVGNGKGLVLEKVVDGVTDSCNTWAADCKGWWSKTDAGTNEVTETGTYRCTFGGEKVSLLECGPYRTTFDIKTTTPTITDPVSGGETGWVAGPVPTGIDPTIDVGDSSGNCMSEWASAPNPLEWVLLPVKCALRWAFVPEQGFVEGMRGRLDDAVLGSSIGGLVGSVGALVASFEQGIGCAGLPIHVEGFGVTLVHTHLLGSCDEPAAGIAAVVKTVLTVGIVGGGIFATIRYLGAVFGFIGFGRFPSGGGKSGVSFD